MNAAMVHAVVRVSALSRRRRADLLSDGACATSCCSNIGYTHPTWGDAPLGCVLRASKFPFKCRSTEVARLKPRRQFVAELRPAKIVPTVPFSRSKPSVSSRFPPPVQLPEKVRVAGLAVKASQSLTASEAIAPGVGPSPGAVLRGRGRNEMLVVLALVGLYVGTVSLDRQ